MIFYLIPKFGGQAGRAMARSGIGGTVCLQADEKMGGHLSFPAKSWVLDTSSFQMFKMHSVNTRSTGKCSKSFKVSEI